MEVPMKVIVPALAALLVLGSPVVAGTAGAEPVTLTRTTVNDGYAKVRKYCDQASRCWTEGHRNVLLQTYDYIAAPPWFRKPVVAAKKTGTKTATLKQPNVALRNAQARMR
jgi:hypothetical protein